MRTIPHQESLQHEFKSDRRRLPLRTLLEAVICMANGPGGTIYLGVEDDGHISGLHPAHTNLAHLQQLLCQHSDPHLAVSVRPHIVEGLVIACIDVPLSPVPIATWDGLYKRRQLQQSNGEPQCVTFVPARPAAKLQHRTKREQTALHNRLAQHCAAMNSPLPAVIPPQPHDD